MITRSFILPKPAPILPRMPAVPNSSLGAIMAASSFQSPSSTSFSTCMIDGVLSSASLNLNTIFWCSLVTHLMPCLAQVPLLPCSDFIPCRLQLLVGALRGHHLKNYQSRFQMCRFDPPTTVTKTESGIAISSQHTMLQPLLMVACRTSTNQSGAKVFANQSNQILRDIWAVHYIVGECTLRIWCDWQEQNSSIHC